MSVIKGATAVVVVVYAILALYLLVQQRWLDAVMWVLIGSGLALSVSSTPEAWRTRPRWLRWVASGTTVAGLLLFIARVVLDWRG